MLVRIRRPDALVGARRYRDLLARTVPLAVELRHEPILAVRDGDEMVCTYGRCSALGYGDAAENAVGGALLEDECPIDAVAIARQRRALDELRQAR
jgi:hypothetical protein